MFEFLKKNKKQADAVNEAVEEKRKNILETMKMMK